MTSLLLLFSFFIHTITLLLIFHLHGRLKREGAEQMQEIEALLSEFTQEIRIENERLESKLEAKPTEVDARPILSNKGLSKQPSVYSKPSLLEREKKDQMKDSIETSIESRVLQLYQEGKEIDSIAKQLNRGKTEVALLIKLHEEKLNEKT